MMRSKKSLVQSVLLKSGIKEVTYELLPPGALGAAMWAHSPTFFYTLLQGDIYTSFYTFLQLRQPCLRF